MRHPFRNLLLVLATAALLAAATASPTAASEPGPDAATPPSGEQPESSQPGPRDAFRSLRDIIAPFWPGRSCTFEARADNPHPSGRDASGHGAWEDNSSDNCPARADVTVELQARWCLEGYWLICDWITVGTKTENNRPDEQVAVHYRCHTTEDTTWRTKTTVRVRISWWFDKRDTDTKVKNVNCRPDPAILRS